nr:lysozyme inhibitor LprI family protein [Rubellimicrobium aerolatum]
MAVLLALAAGPVAAQDCGARPTQAEMNACAAEAWRAADAELNRAYGQALEVARRMDARGDGAPERTLREAQRAWVAFRDLACAAEAQPFQPGSITGLIAAGCLERLTRARTDDLAAYVGGLQ